MTGAVGQRGGPVDHRADEGAALRPELAQRVALAGGLRLGERRAEVEQLLEQRRLLRDEAG